MNGKGLAVKRLVPSLKSVSFILILGQLGCSAMSGTTAQVQAIRQISTPIDAHDPVAIVVSHETTKLASDAVGCISKALNEGFPNLRISPPEEFYKVAFPDIALELAPRGVIYLPLLLKDSAFQARIDALGLRYLISIQGKTDQDGKPIIGGERSITVLGWSAKRVSSVTASILDLREGQSGEIKASSLGEPWFVCIGLVVFCAPFGAPAFTEAEACDQIGKAVVEFFARESASQREQAPRSE